MSPAGRPVRSWSEVDVWQAYVDPGTPDDVRRRLLAVLAARSTGRPADPIEDSDKPVLARHLVWTCAAHDEQVRPGPDGWEHLSDCVPCPPREGDPEQ
jgi:hypothetical protein